ncbi:MAG TPA: outer membrane beta-barrel protein [Thermoanaerobaculia bacterium]|jgi:outer membrane protein W|nr:outer membrane beta-barrel protein [Thermoanaerobaculia bacterium]
MTKRFAILAGLFFVVTPLFAQKAAMSVFVANPGGGWSSNQGSTANGDVGIGAEYWFTPRVSAAVNVSRHQDEAAFIFFDPNGFPTTTFHHVYEYPIDALLRYRFAGNERWKPYVGGGLRGVRAFDAPFGGRAWKFAPEINGGVTFLMTKKLGLDLDAKAVSNQTRYTGVNDTRVSIGLSWHF